MPIPEYETRDFSFVLGPIIFQASADCTAEIEKVGFSIDNGVFQWKYIEPYTLLWVPPWWMSFHSLTVQAHGKNGVIAQGTRKIASLGIFPFYEG
jgi:hypothetical protein